MTELGKIKVNFISQPDTNLDVSIPFLKGEAGVGIPEGGLEGQVLSKVSQTNFDTQWVTPQSADGGLLQVSTDETLTGLGTSESPLSVVPTDLSTYALKSEIPDVSQKQETLVSGVNIKTINNEAILGAGNLTLVEYSLPTATNEVLGGVKIGDRLTITEGVLSADVQTTDISGKQDTLVSGTNIKTINNESLVGSGNIAISGGGGAITQHATYKPNTTNLNIISNSDVSAIGQTTNTIQNSLHMTRFVPQISFTSSKTGVVATIGGVGDGNVVIIESNADGQPSNWLATSSGISATASGLWEVDFEFSFIAGKQYWVCFYGNGATLRAFSPAPLTIASISGNTITTTKQLVVNNYVLGENITTWLENNTGNTPLILFRL
jgi:hypothetical protein